MHIYICIWKVSKIQVMCPLISLYRQFTHKSKDQTAQNQNGSEESVGQGWRGGEEDAGCTHPLPDTSCHWNMRWTTAPRCWRLLTHLSSDTPQLTGTSNASWVSSSIWILMDMSFPEGVGGGFCPCSKVLIPEFSGAPSRDPGVGFCSISPMMKGHIISAGSSEKEKYINQSRDSLIYTTW